MTCVRSLILYMAISWKPTVFDLVCLLDRDANSDTVHTGFDIDLLVFVAGDGQGVEEELGG